MPSAQTLLAFLGVAAVLAVIPGPSVLFIVGRSVAHGRRVGLLSVIGADLGLLLMAVLVAFGIGALITASEVAYGVIKVGGILSLVFLGVQAIRHRKRDATPSDAGTSHSPARALGQAFVVGATNPKTLAILTAALPQFVSPDAGATWAQLLVFGVIFWGLALLSDSVWALGAGTARDWLARSAKRREALGAAGGVMMITLGGVLALESRAR
ncbi:MAG: LysE family translocator [Microbacterium sp.]